MYFISWGFDAFRPHFLKRRDDFEAIRNRVASEAGPDLDIILFLLHDNRLKDHQNQICSSFLQQQCLCRALFWSSQSLKPHDRSRLRVKFSDLRGYEIVFKSSFWTNHLFGAAGLTVV